MTSHNRHSSGEGTEGAKGGSAPDSRLEFMPTIAPANRSSRSRITKTPRYLLRTLERTAFTVGDEKQRFFISNPLDFPGSLPLPTVFYVKRKLVNIPAASYALWLCFRPSENHLFLSFSNALTVTSVTRVLKLEKKTGIIFNVVQKFENYPSVYSR